MALCRALKHIIRDARIVVGIRRVHAVESSCARRRRGLLGLSVEQHDFRRCCGPLLRLPVWFVDNVITSGTTLRAANLAFGTGDGIVFADASSYALIRSNCIGCGNQHAGGLDSRSTVRLTNANYGRKGRPNCHTDRYRRPESL